MDLEKTISEGLESVKSHMDVLKGDLENRYDKLQEQVKSAGIADEATKSEIKMIILGTEIPEEATEYWEQAESVGGLIALTNKMNRDYTLFTKQEDQQMHNLRSGRLNSVLKFQR